MPGGNLEKIKDNVWKREQDGKRFSVKRYQSMSTIVKVREVHDLLKGASFSNIVPVVADDNPLLFVQPWLDGARAANFKKRVDRTDSLAVLHALHETAEQIDWHASPYLHPYPLIAKWENRIVRFREIRGMCEAYIGKGRVDEILFFARNALALVKKNYRTDKDCTLLHGDVVHHNMLRDEGGIIRLIDFDLACVGPAGTEIALWMHRVLPQIGYDVEFLFDEQPSLQKLDRTSKTLLLYPNELLREWLYLFTLSPASRERHAKQLIPFTESALSHWPKLWYDVERINI
ncbi:phosphotransferase [Sporosarcina sp. FSL K6-1522]|uniref:phosphotransferase n=1 Tax=Sporosarcina sp. FSL K6-1522 TaxID=2921554 RepID=UPI00315B2E33